MNEGQLGSGSDVNDFRKDESGWRNCSSNLECVDFMQKLEVL